MILVTGGAGFIGSCFVKKLNDNNIKDILIVDRLGSGDKWKNLVGKKFFDFIHKDEFIELLMDKEIDYDFDAIIHLGACSTTTESNMDYLFDNNVDYSIRLAEFAAENSIRFIYASSAATYGDGTNGYSDNVFDGYKPLNPYGFSKLMFDNWIIDNKLDNVFTGLKYFNVFGPNEYHKGAMASMVYKSYNQVLSNGKVQLFKSNSDNYKDGGQKRDFIYVKDCSEILYKILMDDTFSGIYNIGTGNARSWNDLATAVFKSMNMESQIEYIDMPDNLKNQYQNFTEADMNKLKKTKCNIEFQTLEDSIDDYVNNHLSQKWQNF